MDPVSIGIGTIVQLGMTAVGAYEAHEGSKTKQEGYGIIEQGAQQINQGAIASNEEQKKQIQYEQANENTRRNFMEISARRQQLENFRNFQRQRATALENATTQGASQGSGLQGGYAQVRGQSEWNALGINQGLYMGRSIFDTNAMISQSKIAQANASLLMQQGQLTQQRGQMKLQEGSDQMSLGMSFIGGAGAGGRLAGQFFPGAPTVPQNVRASTGGPANFNGAYYG